jgi:hypothetical protein
MSFFRHREIFRSDVIRLIGERPSGRSPAHRLDEFPAGYSSASCTPAALASASPTGIHSATRTRHRQRSFQSTATSVLTFCVTPGGRSKCWRPLLALAQKSFDVFVTIDRHIEYQQTLKNLTMGILSAHVRNNEIASYRPLFELLLRAAETVIAGEVIHVRRTWQ